MLPRCPSCQTTFRVTTEQLKVRLGKVRCGSCQQVFNALEALVDALPDAAANNLPAESNGTASSRAIEQSGAAERQQHSQRHSAKCPPEAYLRFLAVRFQATVRELLAKLKLTNLRRYHSDL